MRPSLLVSDLTERPTSIRAFTTPEEMTWGAENAEVMGYSVKPFREGYLLSRRRYGKWWVYVLLGLFTSFVGPLVYFLYCYNAKAERIYLRLAPPAPMVSSQDLPPWVLDAVRRHRDQGVDYTRP